MYTVPWYRELNGRDDVGGLVILREMMYKVSEPPGGY
jgi:hypothetical protein